MQGWGQIMRPMQQLMAGHTMLQSALPHCVVQAVQQVGVPDAASRDGLRGHTAAMHHHAVLVLALYDLQAGPAVLRKPWPIDKHGDTQMMSSADVLSIPVEVCAADLPHPA